MLNYLKELLSQNPFVTAIELASKGIVAIDGQSLALLSRFTELQKIDLSDNYIKRLPSDLSALRLITDFDLNGNPIEDVQGAVNAIRDGMPNLRALKINLHEEE